MKTIDRGRGPGDAMRAWMARALSALMARAHSQLYPTGPAREVPRVRFLLPIPIKEGSWSRKRRCRAIPMALFPLPRNSARSGE